MEVFNEHGASPHDDQSSEAEGRISIDFDVSSTFTYASYQNSIPTIRSAALRNATADHVGRCELTLSAFPPFIRMKTWVMDRLAPGDTVTLTDRKTDFDVAYLAGLNEAERGEIMLTLSAAGKTLAERRIPVRLLARDEWGGVGDMAQLLPAFVMPNDPAIAQLLKSAAERLAAHGHPSGLDGYQSQDPQRAYMLTASVYSAVAGLALHYAEPPASFETRGQKVRRPQVIVEEGLATCLDTTLLFAAALEAVGLHPVLLLFEGHAAVGVWLVQKTLSKAIETDPMEIRKALASRELVVFETTGVTQRPAITMETAERLLAPRLGEDQGNAFRAAIDVRRARSGGITPLPSHDALRRGPTEGQAVPASELPLPAAPSFAALPSETVEVKPGTASGRLDRWQKKLLDLTLRNRLLNFPDSARTIPFLCTDVAYMEDRLSGGAALKLISIPEQNPIGERDPELHRSSHGTDLHRGFADEALHRDELPSLLERKQLDARLTDLYRQVRNDQAEGGTNTLFLAIGFLRWKRKPQDQRSYRAPLLLLPVKLEQRSASARFTLRFHEDEPRFNATLAQFVEREFELKLPYAGGELPLESGKGVDVPRLLATMRHAVRDVPGMEVLDEAALSTFSFAKFLMWKDLTERIEALRQNRVVRHLLDTPDQPFHAAQGGGAPFRDERELDRVYAPAEIISLLPADSSQTAASMAAVEGRDFVIVGPPGTGKSQTIANMIANCLAAGKTVLFVAEKTAALDVVYRRLREHGLGDHCIELHSSKADRRHFLRQLKAAWEHGQESSTAEWVAINDRLRLRRDELNSYVEALHRPCPNGWTPYLALGIALRAAGEPGLVLAWPDGESHDAQALRELEDLAAELGKTFDAVERHPALALVDVRDWSAGWQDRLLAAAQSLRNAADLLTAAVHGYCAILGLAGEDHVSQPDIAPLIGLAMALRRCRDRDLSIAFDPDFGQCAAALAGFRKAVGDYREAARGLTASFAPAVIRDLDIEALTRQWQDAKATFWPGSVLAKRKVEKLVQGHAERGQVDVERDLPLLGTMRAGLLAVERNLLSVRGLAAAGMDSDLSVVEEILDGAAALRAALDIAMRRPGLTSDTVMRLLGDGKDQQTLLALAERLIAASDGFRAAVDAFNAVAGRDVAAGEAGFAAVGAKVAALPEARPLLRDWSAWCQVRQRAVARRLDPLIDLLEQGRIAPGQARAAFRLGYARWWLPKLLDGDAVLRGFRRFQHEHAISDFREIDDLVRAQASRRVISALAHGLPAVQSVPRKSELGLLRDQMQMQRPSQSIREMIRRMPQSFPRLAPCMLMSPLSIAQYLPPDQALFDVVIFDEASQIATWDAVGAIARARQTIIVGDPKQLPPTNFFGRNEEEDEVAEHERDLESILDEAKAAGIPVRDLRWHYRSRSESLIAFSNHHYYQNRLVTFPSPSVEDRAVQLRKIPRGIYDRGKSRTNRIEAEAVAGEATARMKTWLRLPEKERPTLGVITFNAQQQSLIMDLLDAARREDPALEWFFAEERIEATIVKNLENVQGDERDVILFSITFWKDAAGKLAMDFGALNRDGGERRLNVAVTRARQELIVFSGFTADQIDLNRTKALAVHHLKTFLDFAERGAIALPAQDEGSVGGFDSAFEEAVSTHLVRRGWLVVPQVGVSGFRIDLGIRHPDRPGVYLAGVECDGATYHSSATARDRDKVREQVLRGLGWNILRVWSTDWWFDAAGCADRLHAGLEQLLAESRARIAVEEDQTRDPTCDGETHDAAVEEDEGSTGSDENLAVEGGEFASALGLDVALKSADGTPRWFASRENAQAHLSEKALNGYRVVEIGQGRFEMHREDALSMLRAAPASYAQTSSVPESPAAYAPAELSAFHPDPDRFFELGYRDVLRRMIATIMVHESPLRAETLAQRISRAHGWQRTGGRIREQITMLLQDVDRTEESSGEFLWRLGAVVDILPFRPPANEEARRPIVEIALAELAGAVHANPALLAETDPARELGRLLGVERLSAGPRARLDEAIARARPPIDQA
jgi:hypothetical protein